MTLWVLCEHGRSDVHGGVLEVCLGGRPATPEDLIEALGGITSGPVDNEGIRMMESDYGRDSAITAPRKNENATLVELTGRLDELRSKKSKLLAEGEYLDREIDDAEEQVRKAISFLSAGLDNSKTANSTLR